MKLALAAGLLPLLALAEDGAFFDTPGEEDPAPAVAAPAPFSEWDGITQLFPAPHAKSKSHAESAESAEFESHAESAESAESKPHAESAEFAEFESHPESAEPGGASSPSEPRSPAGGAAERSEAEGVIQHSAFGIQHSSLPSLVLVGEFPLPDSAPEGLSGIAWTFAPDLFGRPVNYSEHMPDGSDVFAPDSYALCEDSGGRVHWATIGLALESGAVTSAVFRASWQPIDISASADLEGIAHKRRTNRRCALFLSDEGADHIYRRRLSPRGDHDAGASIMSAPLPDPLKSPRGNKGVEAMCLSPDENTLWVANEDSLPEDGPVSSTANGSRVRLYALDVSDRQWPPADPRWWFYELDAAAGGKFPHLPDPFNGLAELCALPDGRLLALERTYGLRTRSADDPRASLIAISIYLVDPLGSAPASPSHAESAESKPHAEAAEFAESKPHAESAEFAEFESHAESAESAEPGGASSPSEPGSPVGGAAERSEAEGVIRHSAFSIQHSPYSPLPKVLLWKGLTGRANYEGMTLGPELADGSRALILVSDGDVTRKGAFAFPWSKRLLSFRIQLPDAER